MMVKADTLALPGIRHAFFTREGGVSGGFYASLNGGIGSHDSSADVAENRARMAAALGVEPRRLLTAYQIHSPHVVVAETPWTLDARPRADGIVTRTPGLAVGVSTADCGPVLFAEPQARVVGAAHAGWRGALAGIVEATIAAMERLGAARSEIRAALGPMIRQRNYEVGPDLIDRFAADGPCEHAFLRPRLTPRPRPVRSWRLRRGTADAGRHPPHRGSRSVHLRRCRRYFSATAVSTHRAEADYGRHVNAIALT